MTSQECEIVADAGLRLREIIRAMKPGQLDILQTALDVNLVVGMLACLPLTTEPTE